MVKNGHGTNFNEWNLAELLHANTYQRKLTVTLNYQGGSSSDIVSSNYFHPSNVTEHVTSRVSRGKFKTK